MNMCEKLTIYLYIYIYRTHNRAKKGLCQCEIGDATAKITQNNRQATQRLTQQIRVNCVLIFFLTFLLLLLLLLLIISFVNGNRGWHIHEQNSIYSLFVRSSSDYERTQTRYNKHGIGLSCAKSLLCSAYFNVVVINFFFFLYCCCCCCCTFFSQLLSSEMCLRMLLFR